MLHKQPIAVYRGVMFITFLGIQLFTRKCVFPENHTRKTSIDGLLVIQFSAIYFEFEGGLI